MKRSIAFLTVITAALLLSVSICSPAASAQSNGKILTHPPIQLIRGAFPGPPPSAETPGSLACVYKLVKQVKDCPIATSKNLPTGGVGAVVLVDAFDQPDAVSDLQAYAKQFGIKYKSFQVVFATGKRPSYNSGWALEEALDIEMAAAMAPKAKIYLVEAATNNNGDLYFAEQVAAKLVQKAGSGVISNSWQGSEYSGEIQDGKKYFSTSGVVYTASSGDGGYNNTGFPAVFNNVISAGGTYILRNSGKYVNEIYWSGGGSGESVYVPRPTYQNIIKSIVGAKRGVPDISAAATNVAMYDTSASGCGGWCLVSGTSISSPLLAGMIDAAGSKAKSSTAELAKIYADYANKKNYKAEWRDITGPPPHCKVGWDFCDGVGSVQGYKGK